MQSKNNPLKPAILAPYLSSEQNQRRAQTVSDPNQPESKPTESELKSEQDASASETPQDSREDQAENADESEVSEVEQQAAPVDQHTELKEQLAKANEEVLRSRAEVTNIQRRADQEVEKARKFAVEKLISDLLPVVDSLELAISTIEGEESQSKSTLEGVNITLKSLLETLVKYGVEVVAPHGEPFDPERHQAMSMVENPDCENNTVLEVYRKGYLLNGRLVRPAMVVVNRFQKS